MEDDVSEEIKTKITGNVDLQQKHAWLRSEQFMGKS
jgi:hypothetical protein